MILIVSIALATLIVLFGFVVFTPNVPSERFLMNKDTTIDPNLQKAINFFGGDISALLPEGMKKKKRQNHKLQRLFITSGNPWNLNANEFFVIQIFLAIAGLMLGGLASFMLSSFMGAGFLVLLTGVITVLGYFYPYIYYKGEADTRLQAFKRELPIALDFLIIAKAGGTYSLQKAIEEVVPYLPEGVMKVEFQTIVDSLNSGKSLEVSLAEFGERAPTEGIQAFVKALNNASKLDSPVDEILRNRAEASRDELNAEIDKAIASLDKKILGVFGPMSYVSIMIVVLAPVASTLAKLFG